MSKNRKRNTKGQSRTTRLRLYGAEYMGKMLTPHREVLKQYRLSAAGLVDADFQDHLPPHQVWQGPKHQGVENIHEIELDSHPRKNIWLVVVGSIYYFKRKDQVLKTEEYSLQYSSKLQAMTAYQGGMLKWRKADG